MPDDVWLIAYTSKFNSKSPLQFDDFGRLSSSQWMIEQWPTLVALTEVHGFDETFSRTVHAAIPRAKKEQS
ncbi:MAG: hypothetical protein E1N59_701 [Puniceicoccaceae bacterium 5H]|nr:MAG: hypothetical protein E1N59_701 [Puniceicoccaceae bacterium 5H]